MLTSSKTKLPTSNIGSTGVINSQLKATSGLTKLTPVTFPVTPVYPINPIGPTNPVGPVKPVFPIGPVKPIFPVGPTNPVGPVKPVFPVGPVNPVFPVGPTNPVGPVKPVFPVGPVNPFPPVSIPPVTTPPTPPAPPTPPTPPPVTGGGYYPGGLGLLPVLGGLGGGFGGGAGGGVSGGVVDSSAVAADTGTSVGTPAATVAQGIDLEVLDVRVLDNGDASQQIGPRYRVTFRNAGSTPVDHEFNVALIAADDANLTANLPTSEVRVKSLPSGDPTYVDLRLPASSFSMGRDSHSEFAKLFVAVDSHGEVNDTNRANNAAGVDRTAIQPAA